RLPGAASLASRDQGEGLVPARASLQPPAVVGQQEGETAQVIDRDRDGQLPSAISLALLDEVRDLAVRLERRVVLLHDTCLRDGGTYLDAGTSVPRGCPGRPASRSTDSRKSRPQGCRRRRFGRTSSGQPPLPRPISLPALHTRSGLRWDFVAG